MSTMRANEQVTIVACKHQGNAWQASSPLNSIQMLSFRGSAVAWSFSLGSKVTRALLSSRLCSIVVQCSVTQ